ncbi:hypothetical protein BCR42DRAFT_398123 [Absidia repens]|uniref:Uncharacterized protein n=1 Tax=Absidia repens TaxID=90262 RepID=A0A1X2HYU5_9FUNG|nr:hypothetical protein BCR42DRAFT_398123 [Absidia repens]
MIITGAAPFREGGRRLLEVNLDPEDLIQIHSFTTKDSSCMTTSTSFPHSPSHLQPTFHTRITCHLLQCNHPEPSLSQPPNPLCRIMKNDGMKVKPVPEEIEIPIRNTA